jgi:hypothetical protein
MKVTPEHWTVSFGRPAIHVGEPEKPRYGFANYWQKRLEQIAEDSPRFYNGKPYEQRCAVAALCEPCLLKDKLVEHYPVQMLDIVTRAFAEFTDRKDEGFIALKKGLAYGWSVAAPPI